MFATVAYRSPRRSIETSVVVSCPRSAAIARARTYFDDRRSVVFRRVLRNVAISLDSVTVRTSFTPRYEEALHLRWKPTHGSPFPEIDGLLTARAHATHAVLRFAGTYTPPLGNLARTFDALVGRHIARVAIQMLFRDIKGAIERRRLQECVSGSLAVFDANARESHDGGTAGVSLRGNVAIRKDGSYVACAITLAGETPPFAALEPCDRALNPERVAWILGELLSNPTFRVRPTRRRRNVGRNTST